MANLPMPQGLTDADLECVMLDVVKLRWENESQPTIGQLFGEGFNPNDFFYGATRDSRYAQGPVYDDVPHVTLLFGIHPSLTYEEDVNSVLADWMTPDLMGKYVSFFEGSEETVDGVEEYYCIVLHMDLTAWLMNAHKRLEALPHTTRFTEYKPHMTLAYIRKDANLQLWLERMNDVFANRVFYAAGLNLGTDD